MTVIFVVMLNIDDSFFFWNGLIRPEGEKNKRWNSLYSVDDRCFRHLGNFVFGCIAIV